ncbi:MAG: hypothetical protein EGMGGAKC_00064 [Dehalococcoides mccartyi]|nr:hypothetical protein [Dehalococcoides mccartyi]
MTGKIKCQLAALYNLRRTGTGQAAQDSPDSGRQFTRAEWLGNIIISPGVQPRKLIIITGFGGKHNNRHAGFQSQLAADFNPVHTGQHDIQNNQGRFILSGYIQPGYTIRSSQNPVTVSGQVQPDQFNRFGIIFYNQYSGSHSYYYSSKLSR